MILLIKRKLPQQTFSCSNSTIINVREKCEICSKLTIKTEARTASFKQVNVWLELELKGRINEQTLTAGKQPAKGFTSLHIYKTVKI